MAVVVRHEAGHKVYQVSLELLRKSPGNKRLYNDRRAQRIASRYDPFLAGAIHCVARDGLYWVIDGWHRVEAARMAGHQTIEAMITDGYSPADDARAFDILNTARVRISAGDEFWARVDYGEPVASAVLDLCRSLGIEVLPTTGDGAMPSGSAAKKAHATRAYAQLQLAASRYGISTLGFSLRTIRAAWPDESRALDALPIAWVTGFIGLYQSHPHWSLEHLEDALGQVTVARLIALVSAMNGARGSSSGDNGAGPLTRSVREVLVDIYNRGLRRRRLPDASASDMKRVSLGQNPWIEAVR